MRMSQQPRLIAGTMSGTSGDGVDVAIVRIEGSGLKMAATLVKHHHVAFDTSIRTLLFAVRESQQIQLHELARLGREISLTYARCVNEALLTANLQANQLSAVAAHGQTLFHEPPDTIQWLDPSLLAAEVGCPVVSDFRRADCAAGGQGAPLVPFADYVLFRDPKKSRVLLNIGGIANLTFIPAGASIDQILAFDTGPGNCISDWLMRTHVPGGLGYDENGDLALSGAPHSKIVEAAIKTPYFNEPPPKSTDGPAMIAAFDSACAIANKSSPPIRLETALASACVFTAATIANSIRTHLSQAPDELIVSGGGSHNRCIMRNLATHLPGIPIRTLDELGVKSDAKEAIAFALLAAATLDGVPSNVPSATGARRAVILGSITPKPSPG
jgi:anhydro-N-acetylmuramic acid kinase